jgi:aryl-alcohol dehydrogenase-like predicted oxidoreductase
MSTSAAASGAGQAMRFRIGGDIEVNRLGFGAMRLTGAGIWGDHPQGEESRRVLRRLPEVGVNLVDTADCYGPHTNEDLIRRLLHPYPNMLIATKGGLCRYEAGKRGVPLGRPEYLRHCVAMSLRRLGIETIDLWQLHRLDPQVPMETQFGVIRDLRAEGKIRHVGLSAVTVTEIEVASAHFPVSTIQNRYNIAERTSEDVLDYCERHQIGFMPYGPLNTGRLAGPRSALREIAVAHGATPAQLALAWLLMRSPVMLPIPGTSSVEHLEENMSAGQLTLSSSDFQRLSNEFAT